MSRRQLTPAEHEALVGLVRQAEAQDHDWWNIRLVLENADFVLLGRKDTAYQRSPLRRGRKTSV